MGLGRVHAPADIIEIPGTNAKISLADIYEGVSSELTATVSDQQ
jgi:hypothetical protein